MKRTKYIPGVRLHDYGCGTPDAMFARVKADGYDCVQLAYPASIEGIHSFADVDDAIVRDTQAAITRRQVSVGVLGCYVELAIDDEKTRLANVETFRRMLPVCQAVSAGCIGTETTAMRLQPAGTTRERGRYLLCKSLEQILPEAERLGVTVGIEAVSWHSMNTPEATREVLDTMQSPALGVIFDAGNLLTLEDVDRQRQLWARTATLYGEKIKAVHFKTQGYQPDGTPVRTGWEGNRIDWDSVFDMLHQLPQTLPVLREEAVPADAAVDLAEMHRLFAGR